jgi:hypothetical protein
MIGRETVTFRMLAQTGQAQGARIGDQESQHAFPRGQRADLGHPIRFYPDRDELFESRFVAVEHAQGAVAGTCHGARLFDHMAQKGR